MAEPPGGTDQAAQSKCISCLGSGETGIKLHESCAKGCSMCAPCIKRFITMATKQEWHFPAKCCPQGDFRLPKAAPKIDWWLDHGVIDAETYTKYRTKEVEYSTLPRDRVYCANQHCSAYFPDGLNDHPTGTLTCPDCNTLTCTTCKNVITEPNGLVTHTCQREKDEAFAKAAKNLRYQPCPGCQRTVELAEACNHISCTCGAEFCYICGQKWPCTSDCPRYGPVRDADVAQRDFQHDDRAAALPLGGDAMRPPDPRRFGRVFFPEDDVLLALRGLQAADDGDPEPEEQIEIERVEVQLVHVQQVTLAQVVAVENQHAELLETQTALESQILDALRLHNLIREIQTHTEETIAIRNQVEGFGAHDTIQQMEGQQPAARHQDIANQEADTNAFLLRAWRYLQVQVEETEALDATERVARALQPDVAIEDQAVRAEAERVANRVLTDVAQARIRRIQRLDMFHDVILELDEDDTDQRVEPPATDDRIDLALQQAIMAHEQRLQRAQALHAATEAALQVDLEPDRAPHAETEAALQVDLEPDREASPARHD